MTCGINAVSDIGQCKNKHIAYSLFQENVKRSLDQIRTKLPWSKLIFLKHASLSSLFSLSSIYSFSIYFLLLRNAKLPKFVDSQKVTIPPSVDKFLSFLHLSLTILQSPFSICLRFSTVTPFPSFPFLSSTLVRHRQPMGFSGALRERCCWGLFGAWGL